MNPRLQQLSEAYHKYEWSNEGQDKGLVDDTKAAYLAGYRQAIADAAKVVKDIADDSECITAIKALGE